MNDHADQLLHRVAQTLAAGDDSALVNLEPARRRTTLAAILPILASHLLSDDPASEQRYVELLEQTLELTIQQAPTELTELVQQVPLAQLYLARHRQLLRFYRALGAGLRDQLAEARSGFAALLNEPDLDEGVRGRALNSGAVFARMQGDYQQARAWYDASMTIWQRRGDTGRHARALLNSGILAYELQDYAAAEQAFLAAAERFAALGDEYRGALSRMELGLVYRDLGRWNESLAASEAAALVFTAADAADLLGRVRNNIGEVQLLSGAVADALGSFAVALDLMETRVYVVDTLLHRGLAQQAQGYEQAALLEYGAALELAANIGRSDIAPMLRYRVAHARRRLGDHAAARADLAEAAAAVEAHRAPLADQGLLIGLMGRWQTIFEEGVLSALADDDPATAFHYAERARARAFADLLARRAGAVAEPVMPIDAASACAALQPGELVLAYFTTGVAGPERALLAAIPPEASGVREAVAVPAGIVLFALTHSGLRAHICPLDPNILHGTSAYLSDGRRFLRPAILRRCSEALFGPVSDLLRSAERVTIVPHGPLHQLPFVALHHPDGTALIEQALELSYTPSVTMLLRSPKPSASAARMCLALGDDSGDLRHTAVEAQVVVRICGGDLFAPGADAAARLLAEAPHYRRLHLACHGEFRLDEPLESALLLGDGQRLTAADVLAGPRLHAELVTLSACRSGMSRVLRGDEPIGLVRAFLSAGAQAVLVTQWPVEDESARLLMEYFYRELEAAGDQPYPAAMLRTAQLALRAYTRADGSQPFSAPEFWAAYQITRVRQSLGRAADVTG
ncbi:MAG: CHAT domain-containing protein [Oscillochloris sp.]|nr:CHAT domain-containing protein [Oscillochloris sp.]